MLAPATRQKLAGPAALGLSLAIAVAALHGWLSWNALPTLDVRVPGRDGRPAVRQLEEGPVDFAGVFLSFDGAPSDLPGAWPRFRGARFDNIAHETPPLAESWGADLIVMGAYGQPRVSEFVFGSATRTILDRVERPILFSR